MRKNSLFVTALVLGISLAPLYVASATAVSEDDLMQPTTAEARVEISTGDLAAVSTGAAVVEVSSEIKQLSDYFIAETPAFKKAGQTKLSAWQFKLQYRINKLEEMINIMADDQVVTSGELFDLKDAIDSYDRLRSSANKELAFYYLNIPEDELVETYWKLAIIPDGQFSADDKKESVKRFFVNLTGKDVKVKMGMSDKLGVTLTGSIVIGILLILL